MRFKHWHLSPCFKERGWGRGKTLQLTCGIKDLITFIRLLKSNNDVKSKSK